MNYLKTIFVIFVICVVIGDANFGQRLSGRRNKTKKPTQESALQNSSKQLDKQESYHSYQYALPPVGIDINADQQHLPAHANAYSSSLPPLDLPKDVHLSPETLAAIFGPTDQISEQYVPKNLPNHFESELPLYRDDPKDQLKSFLPQVYSEHSDAPVYREGSGPIQPLLSNHEPLVSHHEPLESLSQTYAHYNDYIPGIPGTPWKDYPLYHEIPHTSFSCVYTKYPGFYADVETGCQVWHYCQLDSRHDRFLCPNGTLFNQKTRVCDWWYNVHCGSSIDNYGNNIDLYRDEYINQYLSSIPQPLSSPLLASHQPFIYYKDIDTSIEPVIYAESSIVPKKVAFDSVNKRVGTSNAGNETKSLVANKSDSI